MPLSLLKRMYRQFFPAAPGFTEKDLPDLHGKVREDADEMVPSRS